MPIYITIVIVIVLSTLISQQKRRANRTRYQQRVSARPSAPRLSPVERMVRHERIYDFAILASRLRCPTSQVISELESLVNTSLSDFTLDYQRNCLVPAPRQNVHRPVTPTAPPTASTCAGCGASYSGNPVCPYCGRRF